MGYRHLKVRSPHNQRSNAGRKHKTHILLILVILFLMMNKINQMKPTAACNDAETQSNTKQKFQLLECLHIVMKLKRSNHLMKNSDSMQKTLILLLILLSNDVNPNPGPKPTSSTAEGNCSMCNKITSTEDSLECNTCYKWCHISCTEGKDQSTINRRKDSFQWICPTASCSPNFKHGAHLQLNAQLISPNRYTPLVNVKENRKIIKINHSPKKHKNIQGNIAHVNRKREINKTPLLKELPKISSKDYIGKDLCRSCSKEVKQNQQAISCDLCERWIHRSCSDMNTHLYNQCKKKNKFTWKCNKCRRDEELNNDRADLTKLEEADMPESWDKIKKNRKEMLIVHMNCRSIINKEEELANIVTELDPDIVTLTETWFDDSSPLQACVPDGYSIIRKDRSDGFKQKYGRNKGGGVAILHKQQIKIEKKKYLTDPIEEILWAHVKTRESFMLGVVYRADYTDIMDEAGEESKIEENIRKVSEVANKVLVTGDFNIDMSDTTHKNTLFINNTYTAYGLKQHVTKPTRIDKTTFKPTILDHIWANEDANIIKSTGTFIGLSDHLGQYMKLNQNQLEEKKTTIKFRNFKRYDVEAFNVELQRNIDASQIDEHLEREDINSATETLLRIIQDTAESHAPMVEMNLKNKKKNIPWFTKDLKEMITSKNELLQDFYSHGLQSYKTRIKILSNKITQLKRSLKEKFLVEKLEEGRNDSRKCWNLLNAVTNRAKVKEAIEPDMMTQAKADTYNRFFATIGTEIQKKLGVNVQPNTLDHTFADNQPQFEFVAEHRITIEKLIDNIRIDVATGNDNIGARLLKDIKLTISPVLAKIINKGYILKTFPDCMKEANIKVIHKKESTEEISNYRPISILPTISKVFERAAVNQLVKYLEENKLLSPNQHAYRKHHSTVTCLFEAINHIQRMLDNKRWTAVASLDLSKAFDSISHQLILQKLSKLGLHRNSIAWIQSYLTNRKQVTKFKQFTSKEEIVSSGVPQGSILGPLLFLCFTNDLFKAFKEDCKIVAYADDTQLIVNARNLHQLKQKIENVITAAQKWYRENSMKNNIGKTEVLVFNTNKRKNDKIKIEVIDEGKPVKIESKYSIKILGVTIDSELNWSNQVNTVKKKAFNITRNIHRVSHLLPRKYRINLYNAIISPQFSYADIIWGGCRQKESKSLQRVQNFAAKSITGHRKYDSATNSLRELNFLNLEQRREVHATVFVHKALLHQNTENINNQYQNCMSTANTRYAEQRKLTVPKHKTTKFEKSPLYRTIKAWNNSPSLPFDNIKQHKTLLQKHLITQNSLTL